MTQFGRLIDHSSHVLDFVFVFENVVILHFLLFPIVVLLLQLLDLFVYLGVLLVPNHVTA